MLNLKKGYKLYHALANYPQSFGPVAHDGVFFEEDAQAKFLRGDLRADVPLMLGRNSFEGSLVQSILGKGQPV